MSNITLSRSTVIRGKLEGQYGVEVAPGTNDAALDVFGLSYKRLEGSRQTNEVADVYMGNPGELPSKHYSSLGFSTYLKKVATPGDKPTIDPLLQACGLAAVLTGGQDVTYNPIQKNIKSMTFWAYLNGHLHKMTGARGSLKISGEMGAQAKAEFSYQALIKGGPTDEVFPITSRPDSCINTLDNDNTKLTLFGTELDLVSFSIDLQNELQHIVTSKGEQVALTNRAVSGEVTVLKPAVSAFDYHTLEGKPCDVGDFELIADGLTATSSAVSLGMVSDLGDHNGAATITIPLAFKRDQGNDDILLKFS